MTETEKIVAQAFTEYVEAFQTMDPRAAAAYCYAPCSLVTDKAVLVTQDAAGTEALFKQLMEGLKARNYGHSEVTDMRVRQVSAGTAFLSVNRIRYKAAGETLERLSETYIFRNTDSGWKIAVAIVQDPGTMLQLS